MKNLGQITLWATLSLLMLGNSSAQQQPQSNIGVLYVFSSGGKQDRGYNQSVSEGIRRATADFKDQVKLSDYLPKTMNDASGSTNFAQKGFDLLIGVGFQTSDAITAAAKARPSSFYAIVDAQAEGPNVRSISFREEEGSYLVGYMAGLKTSTGIIGFVGGMDIPVIGRFEAGFVAGARAANKNIKIFSATLGKTPAAFNDPEGGKRLAATLKAKGADIIFAAAGRSGDGVISFVNSTQCIKASELPKGVVFRNNQFEKVPKDTLYEQACKGNTRPMFFIGVDSNQNYLGDLDRDSTTLNHGLTSMVKNMDVVVYGAIEDTLRKRFTAGNRSYGLAENGISFAYDEFNNALFQKSEYTQLQTVYRQLAMGEIKAPTVRK
jgi:basic membrane protein A and related proteins